MAITYQASRLHLEVLKKASVMWVSWATDPQEIKALAAATGASEQVEQWNHVLADLAVDEVALLPGAEESLNGLRRIRLVQRLTPHVRHRAKYLDVPVAAHHAFVFCHAGRPIGVAARTMAEFIETIGRTTPMTLNGHLQRGDFSKWIRDVFGDQQLATTLRQLEGDYRLNRNQNINDAIAQAVRSRYEFAQGPTG